MPLLLGELAHQAALLANCTPILHVARDGNRLATLEEALSVLRARCAGAELPGLGQRALRPRVAERRDRSRRRIATLAAACPAAPNAETPAHRADHRQRRAAARAAARRCLCRIVRLTAGNAHRAWQELIARLESSAIGRTGTVMEPGEYAVRGGILDLYPARRARPSASTSSATRWKSSALSIP